MPAAGTDADLFVTLHGQQGTSPRIKLPSRPEDFLRGGEDTFRMELQALGEIVKLTVGHNNRGRNPGWHVDHAKLLDEETGRACLYLLYPCLFLFSSIKTTKSKIYNLYEQKTYTFFQNCLCLEITSRSRQTWTSCSGTLSMSFI